MPAALLAAVAALAIALTARGGGPGDQPSASEEVRVDGPAPTEALAVGQTVPDFVAPALDGGQLAWRQFRETPVVLVVWASWCPHCQRELPILGRIAPDFPTVRVVTVTTAIGRHPGPSPREFMRERGLSFPVAIDDGHDRIAAAFGVRSFPTVYWIGRDGVVRTITVGENGAASVRASFRSLTESAG
jgi:peroxiredoxin